MRPLRPQFALERFHDRNQDASLNLCLLYDRNIHVRTPVYGHRNLGTIDCHRIPCCHADGGTPIIFLNARLKAASDS